MTRTEIRILGPLEVAGKDGSLPLPKGRARVLLAILALHPGQTISTDQLLDQMWGASPPATARTKLYGLVSALRKALPQSGPDGVTIETKPTGYALDVDPDQVDAIRFRTMVERPDPQPLAHRIETLRAALALWRGPMLADFRYEPFAQTEIATFEELRVTAIEEQVAGQLEAGHNANLVPELEALIAEHPFRERLRELAMLALYRSGNQQKALHLAHDTRVTFTEELGIVPGPDIDAMEQAILHHDPSLQVARPTATDGLDVAPSDLLAESRKTVTVAFVDVGGASGHESDLEAQRAAARRQHEIINQTIHRYGGTVQGAIGGVIVSVFGLPVAHDDDPVRAVRAAAEVVSSPEADLNLRVGIATGEVVIGEMPSSSNLLGSTPRLAARLQQAATAGEVLVDDETRRRVDIAAVVEAETDILDDSDRRLTAWKLVRTEPPSPETPHRPNWVGRQAELGWLHEFARKSEAATRPITLTVIGEAGIGKSRLATEFTTSIGDSHIVLTGRCPPYGDAITFWPLREVVEAAAGGTGSDRISEVLAGAEDAETIGQQLAGVVGANDYSVRPDVIFPAVRRFFEALTGRRSLVVIFDDLHWAQPTFIDLVEYLADSVHGGLLLLCLARPEFLELRPSWADEGHTLVLAPLDRAQAAELVALGLTGQNVAHERVEEIVNLAGGNPLFIEQMLAALGDTQEGQIPASLRALLVARLDRLGPAERDVVRAASVWGGSFEATDLAELLPAAMHASIPVHLEVLERKKLLSRTGGGQAFEFHHALIRMVAYQTVTKDARARLHEAVADTLDSHPGRRSSEIDEVAGYHLEQAYTYRTELHAEDAHSGDLARRAGEHLTRAGTRAFGRLDAIAAEQLLTRALRLLPNDHPDHMGSARYLVECYQVMGRHDAAGRLLDEIIADVASSDDRPLEYFLRMERAWTRVATGPDPVLLSEIEAELEQAREVFTVAGYDLGLAQIGRLEWHLHLRRGRVTQMEEAANRGLEAAARSTSGRERIGAEWGVAMALETGPRPVDECIERCEQLASDIANPGLASALGYLNAMRGDFDAARSHVDRAFLILREKIRARRPLAHVKRRAGEVAILAGDPGLGEQLLRESLALNTEQGERDMIAQVAAELARLLVRQERVSEAEELSALARQHAPAESIESQAQWRAAQGLVEAMRGHQDEAERLAREAAGLAPEEMLTLRANVLFDLSEVLARAERGTDGAEEVANQAISLFERKGNLRGAEIARAAPVWF